VQDRNESLLGHGQTDVHLLQVGPVVTRVTVGRQALDRAVCVRRSDVEDDALGVQLELLEKKRIPVPVGVSS
jgi:hypothetical protein